MTRDRRNDEGSEIFRGFIEGGNPMYFNVNDVPEVWRDETKALVASQEIRGDGKLLIGIRRDDLRTAILRKRSEENKQSACAAKETGRKD